MSTLTTKENQVLGISTKGVALTPGPVWPSFEKFRVQGNDSLTEIVPGSVGTLVTKQGQFRILQEQDFQHLYGLARDVDRIRQGLRVVLAAARTVQQHRDEVSLETLVEAVLVLGDSPVLPTREHFVALTPEGIDSETDDGDEVLLNPSEIQRPLFETTKNE